ncbi:glycosyltransferase [Paucihalobacter sp.]|uniref:glycosyltransferase n=1 Tax=Paucihalobacter sp. TaxID=2850405 RepID=UPI003D162173
MKILIVLPNDTLGGAEQCLKQIASYYKYEDVTIFFLQTFNTKSWADLEKETNQFYCSLNSRFLGILKFIHTINSQKIEYDYIFTSHISINALIGSLINLKILKTNKFVARESTSIFLRYKGIKLLLYQLFYKIGYKKIDLLICQTDLMKTQLINGFKSIDQRTLVKTIPNPIDFDFLIKERQKPNKLDFSYDFIVSAGRLIDEKGYDILIDAFYNIKKTKKDIKLIILGEGDSKESLNEQIVRLNLTNEVLLAGHVTNVLDYFKKAKLCVVSSRIEGFPNVLLQMMSQNEAVVSTLCAGDISHIEGLITCEPNDKFALINALENALAQQNRTRKTFDTYLENRSIVKFMNKIDSVLKNR